MLIFYPRVRDGGVDYGAGVVVFILIFWAVGAVVVQESLNNGMDPEVLFYAYVAAVGLDDGDFGWWF